MTVVTTTTPKVGDTIVDTFPVRRTFRVVDVTTDPGGRSATYHGPNGEQLLTRRGELVAVAGRVDA